MPLDNAIGAFYAPASEADRLTRGLGQLEAARMHQLLARYAPPAPAVVLDVGGAAGAYALGLADNGYTVHLLDPVPALVALAAARSDAQPRPLASCTVGDARALQFRAASVDLVMLLGPLYHLTTVTDRARALAEAARVLKPGGVLLAAGITRWAAVLYGMVHDLFRDPAFATLAWAGAGDGQNRNPTGVRGGFTTAYYHRPEELRAEVASAELEVEHVLGIEGPASLLTDFDARWVNAEQRATLLRTAELLEAEPSVLGTSAHVLAVARKPEGSFFAV